MESKKVQKLSKAVVATVLASSGIAVVLPQPASAYMFSDLNPSADYYQPIVDLFNRGVVSGYSDGTFRPNNAITRGDAAKMLALALKLNIKNPTNPLFTDVPRSNEYYPYIAALSEADIINGYSDKTFRPQEPITRGQMAKIITLGYKFGVSSKLNHNFKDVSSKNANSNYIQTLVDLGITKGRTPITFEPFSSVTRAQLATFIWRAGDADAGDPLYEIGNISNGQVYINGVAYNIPSNLTSIFNPSNARVLKGAQIEGTFDGKNLVSLSKLTINASGTSAQGLLSFDGGDTSFNGELVINGSHLRFKNWTLNGKVYVAEAPSKSLGDFAQRIPNLRIASLDGFGFIDWGTPSEPVEENYLNAPENETLKPKPTNPSNGWKTYSERMSKAAKYVTFTDCFIRNLFIEQDHSFVSSDTAIDRVTVQGYVRQFELYADANAMYIDTETNLTMYGVGDYKYVYKNTYQNVFFNMDSYMDFLYVGTASGWIDIGPHVYIDEAVIPPKKTPNEIFDDYENDNGNIGIIEDPDGTPVDRDPIENQIVPDKTKPGIERLTVAAEGSSAKVTFTSDEDGTFYYIVREASAKEPTIKSILGGDSQFAGNGRVKEGESVTFDVKNLEQLTEYVVYLVVIDAAENVSERYDAPFQTKDGVAPTIRIKKTEGLYGGKKVQVDFDVNEAGTFYYYIRKDSSAAAPTVDDVIKTHTGKGTTKGKETITVITDKYEKDMAIEPNTKYQIFIVMVDSSGNKTPGVTEGNVTSLGPDLEHPYVSNPKLEYDNSSGNRDKNYFYMYFNEELNKELAENVNNYVLSGTGIVNVTGQKEIKPSEVVYSKKGKGSQVRITIPSVTGFVNGDTLKVTVLPAVQDLAENPFESIDHPGTNGQVDNYADYIHSDVLKPVLTIKTIERNNDQTKAKVTYDTSKAGTHYYMILPSDFKLDDITSRDFVDEYNNETKTGKFQLNGNNVYVGTPGFGPAELGTQSVDIDIPPNLDPFTSYSVFMVVKDRSGMLSDVRQALIKDDSKPPLVSTLSISGGEGNTTDDKRAEIEITTDEGGLMHYWAVPKYVVDPTDASKKILNPTLATLSVPNATSTNSEYQRFAELVKSRGKSASISSGLRKVQINDLNPHTEYVVYVAVEDTFGNITARYMGNPNSPTINEAEPNGEIMKLKYYADVTAPKIVNNLVYRELDGSFTITFSEAIMRKYRSATDFKEVSEITTSTPLDGILSITSESGNGLTAGDFDILSYSVGTSTASPSTLKIKLKSTVATTKVDTTFNVKMKGTTIDHKIPTDTDGNKFAVEDFGKYVWPGIVINKIDDAVINGINAGTINAPASKTMRAVVYIEADLSYNQKYYYAVTGPSVTTVDPQLVMNLVKNPNTVNNDIFVYGSSTLSTTTPQDKQFVLDLTAPQKVGNYNPVFRKDNHFFIFTIDKYGNIVWATDKNNSSNKYFKLGSEL